MSNTARPNNSPVFTRYGEFRELTDRKVPVTIAKKFDVTEDNGKRYYHYTDANGKTIGAKVRDLSKKAFYVNGDISNASLFGQNTCRGSGKYITVTEGEEDALAVSTMFDGKWDVVSLKTGAAGAARDIKSQLEFLEGYENVVLCFDQDDAGRKAVDAVLPLFTVGKAKVCHLPLKDASEMLKANRIREFTSAWWDAKQHMPVGIMSFGDKDLWDAFVTRGTEEIISFPEAFGGLNAMLNGGIAKGEVTVIGALTSIGKSTMVYNLVHGFLQGNKRVGVALLEADKGELVEKMVSLEIGMNISIIPPEDRDYDVYRKGYEALAIDDKLHMIDHHGSSDIDVVFNKLRYLVKGLDCEVLVIDPLQAMIPSNENKDIDITMDRFLKLSKETGASIVVVSHMRKPNNDKPHGASEYDLKGSSSINQIASNTILLTRDKLSEDEAVRNSTKITVVKCRRTGETGVGGWMAYEHETGRMVRTESPEVQEANSIEEF